MSSSGKVFNVILNFLWLKKDFLMAKFYSLQQKLQSGFKPRASTSVVCRRFSPHQVHRYILKTLFHILTCESRSNTGVLLLSSVWGPLKPPRSGGGGERDGRPSHLWNSKQPQYFSSVFCLLHFSSKCTHSHLVLSDNQHFTPSWSLAAGDAHTQRQAHQQRRSQPPRCL